MSEAVRYLCVARLSGDERVFLWKGEDPGPAGVVVDDKGFVLSYSSDAAAIEAALANGWNVATEEPTAYDIDAIERWCRSDAGVRDCTELLNAWNLFTDLPGGENLFRAADARALALYDKLFRACNLPSMTPPGEHYEPVWTSSETTALKHLLLLGMAEFRARFR
jgi:hypothetical protein